MNTKEYRLKEIYYFLFMIMLFVSCQKINEVDLNSKDPQIVIEAEVTDDTTPQTVKITKSVSRSNSETFPTVSDASVILSDNFGNNVTHIETSRVFSAKPANPVCNISGKALDFLVYMQLELII